MDMDLLDSEELKHMPLKPVEIFCTDKSWIST